MKITEAFTLLFGSEPRKAALWQSLAKTAAKRYGFHIYSPHLVWKDQPLFLAGRQRAKGVAGIADPRCFVLQSCIRSIASIEGDVAECGVRQGRSTIFMLTAETRQRQYHLFDSFAGLSEPAAEDLSAGGKASWAAGDLSTDEALARKNLSGFDGIEFHVGWIPDRFTEVADRKFALVHVDVDLYEPTRDALTFFYERTVSGGLIVCDDYGSAHCPGARRAFDEFFRDKPEGLIELPTGQAIVFRR